MPARQQFLPWTYSLLLHGCFVLLLVVSVHWSNSDLASLGGRNPEDETVQATVVDQSLIDQQLAMLKAEQQKKQSEKQELEQNITNLKQQQLTTQQQLNQQLVDLQKQAKVEQDKLASLKAQDAALDKRHKDADTAARRKLLQDEIANEERTRDSRLASLQQKYIALIGQKVHSNWIEPPGTPENLSCTVLVSQLPDGTVTNVQIPICNGDYAVVQSIITAVSRSSPLPLPPDPSLFDKGLKFTFGKKL